MDWDGVGTFALFLASGAVGVAIVALRAYKAKLAARLESQRIQAAESTPHELADQVRDLEAEVRRLTERVDFSEKLITGRTAPAADSGPEGAAP